MAKRMNLVLTNEQYAWLTSESERTSVSASELVRRALGQAYGLDGRERTNGVELRVALMRRRIFGRRAGIALDA
jgi:hypothetical protein